MTEKRDSSVDRFESARSRRGSIRACSKFSCVRGPRRPSNIMRERQELISRAAKLAYPIRDGIPIMLPEEARQIE